MSRITVSELTGCDPFLPSFDSKQIANFMPSAVNLLMLLVNVNRIRCRTPYVDSLVTFPQTGIVEQWL
jgi:hypothetical protein